MGDIYAKTPKTQKILICHDGETVQQVVVDSCYVTVEKNTADIAVVRVGDMIGYEEKQVFPGKSKRMYEGSVTIWHERS